MTEAVRAARGRGGSTEWSGDDWDDAGRDRSSRNRPVVRMAALVVILAMLLPVVLAGFSALAGLF
jgi:hypothetical protein